MTVHLIKLCVGVESVGHLAELQARRRARGAALRHLTRNTPRRAAELLDGGSLYWVVKGVIRVRQRLVAIEPARDADGPRCALVLDAALVRTIPRAHRAFQGWRYLRAEDAPADLPMADSGGTMPPEMAAELGELGLI